MLYTITRPPTDDHTFYMFEKLILALPSDTQIFYMWSNPPDKVIKFLDNVELTSDIVVIAIKDLLDGWLEFNYWHESQQIIPQRIANLVRRHSSKKFILFTSLEHLDLELQESNLHIIPWGGDLVNQEKSYRVLEPVMDKNFDSDKTFICLNRNRRDHRIVALSYLLGTGLDQYGYISYLSNKHKDFQIQPADFLDRIGWEFDERHAQAREAMLKGYQQLLDLPQPDSEEYEIYQYYQRRTNDNSTNFDVHLRPRYQNSFVEIVSESSFCAPSFNVTEKTANAFFACNFPILLGGVGIVQHMRDIGLDVFDDVVDHSYDRIANPFDRIISAIDNNQRILSDTGYVKQCWKQCRSRFESNYEIIRTVYDWYDARTHSKFAEVIQKIC